MTVAVGLEARIRDHLAEHMPAGVQCEAVNPAENLKPKGGSIWVEETDFTAEWRGLGPNGAASHRRRSETGTATLMLIVYREAPRYTDAVDKARALRDEIITAVETAVEARIDLGESTSWALQKRVRTKHWPQQSGATAWAQLTLEIRAVP